MPGRSPGCTERAGASKVCFSASRLRCTARSAASATRARRCWALLTVAVLAYNVLALLQRCIERVHQDTGPALEVSAYHLALQIRSGYEGMLIALPAEQWLSYDDADPAVLVDRLTRLARNIVPRQVASSPRAP